MRRIEGAEEEEGGMSPSKTRVAVYGRKSVSENVPRRREVGRLAVRVGSSVRDVVAGPLRSQRAYARPIPKVRGNCLLNQAGDGTGTVGF